MDRISEAKEGHPVLWMKEVGPEGPHAEAFEALALRFGLLKEGYSVRELEGLMHSSKALYRTWREHRKRMSKVKPAKPAPPPAAKQAPPPAAEPATPARRRAGRRKPPPDAAA